MIKRIVGMAGFLLLIGLTGSVAAQDADDEAIPYLSIEPYEDGSLWVELELPEAPAHPESVSKALAAVLHDTDPDSITDYYDGPEDDAAYWSAYAYEMLRPAAFQLTGEFDFGALAEVLGDLGYRTMDVTVYPPPSYQTAPQWEGKTQEIGAESDYVWAVFALDSPSLLLHLECRRTLSSILSAMAVFPALCLALALFLWLLRRRALRHAGEHAGYAVVRTAQVEFFGIATFWLLTGVYLFWFRPFMSSMPTFYPASAYVLATACGLWLGTGIGAAVLARVYLYPVYRRVPGATWTRGDLARLAFWYSAFFGTVAVGTVFAFVVLDRGLLHFLGYLLVIVLLGFFCYIRMLRSMGFTVQALESGELRERVETLAREAKLRKLFGVYMLYGTKSPVLNALAANKMRVALTDDLVDKLTCEETDAIIAHEIGHLVKNHPIRLHRAKIGFQLLGSLAGVTATLLLSAPFIILLAPDSSAAWMFGMELGLLPGAFLGFLLFCKVSRRFEFEADAQALALCGNPEALIAGLVKITRLNFFPLDWPGSWSALTLTHPSTRRRAHRIAEKAGVSAERMQVLLDGASVGEDHYEVPANAGTDRVFNTHHKTGVQLSNVLFMLLFAAIPPVLLLWAVVHGLQQAPPAELLFPVLVASTVGGLLIFQNFGAMRGFRRLARRFRERLGVAPGSGTFVTLAPTATPAFYDGFTNWDVGLLVLNGGALHYRGDGTSFSLTRDAILDLAILRSRTILLRHIRVLIRYQCAPGGEPRELVLGAGEASTIRIANRKALRLFRELTAWHEGTDSEGGPPLPGAPFGPPEISTVRGQAPWEVYRLPQAIFSGLLAMMAAFALGGAAGLPEDLPYEHSMALAGHVTGLGTVVAYLPAWWRARRLQRAETRMNNAPSQDGPRS